MNKSTSPKPAVPDVLEEFKAYHRSNPSWGLLHIVLSDGNYDDGSVRFCISEAAEKQDSDGERLAKLLLDMSRTQRRKIAREAT